MAFKCMITTTKYDKIYQLNCLVCTLKLLWQLLPATAAAPVAVAIEGDREYFLHIPPHEHNNNSYNLAQTFVPIHFIFYNWLIEATKISQENDTMVLSKST